MGEYYNWINVDRKEYICPNDFDFGNKRWESITRGNIFINVLRDLLANEWNGCRIAWIGDECDIPVDVSKKLLKDLREQSAEYGNTGAVIETVFEYYRNVSGWYKESEEEVRNEIGIYLEDLQEGREGMINTYGIDPAEPFMGLFKRTGQGYKYIINYTKKICYSFEDTRILDEDGNLMDSIDPIPILLGYGRNLDTGRWLGDSIGASDVIDEKIIVLDSIRIGR